MIKIENVVLPSPEQWKAVIRGMRNPMNSWEKSDSFIPCYQKIKCHECEANQKCAYYFEDGLPYKKDEFIGTNDFNLMTRLRNAGTDHSKFMRMIPVYVDIVQPLYWWKECDQYRIGVTTNSCSTMHKIAAKEFTLDDFSHEHLIQTVLLEDIINELNIYRSIYNNYDKQSDNYKVEFSQKDIWYQLIQLLPSSYNQKRTVFLNYEVLANMYHSRKNHKLDEWRTFCKWIETLPYSELITGGTDGKE